MAAVAAGLTAAAPANAIVINWTLSDDVVFSDGGTAAGTFSFDTASDSVTAFDITTTAGTSQPGFVYTSATASLIGNDVIAFALQRNDALLQLVFSGLLSSSSASNALIPGARSANSEEIGFGNFTYRYVTGGSAFGTAAAVPEPASWALMIGGFGLVGLTMRRRTTAITA